MAGRRGGLPLCVLRGCWRIILQVTTRSRLSVLTPKNPSELREGEKLGDLFFSLTEDLVRSDFFFFFFLRESSVTTSPPQHHHSVQLITGFALFLRSPPPTNHLSDQFYLRPPPYFPLSPPPPSKTSSEVRHFTNNICCFSNCNFFEHPPPLPHGYSSRRLFLPFPRLGGRG